MRPYLFVLMSVLLGCSGSDGALFQTCVPGEQIECACAGGGHGVQGCAQDGTWSSCSACVADVECEPAGEPTGVPCLSDKPCLDGNACNGTEVCVAGECWTGVPIEIDDNLYCTIDKCFSIVDDSMQITHTPRGVNDSNPCTEDSCVEDNGGEVRHTWMSGCTWDGTEP